MRRAHLGYPLLLTLLWLPTACIGADGLAGTSGEKDAFEAPDALPGIPIGEASSFVFASADQARAFMRTPDVYTESLSVFDRSFHAGLVRNVSIEEYFDLRVSQADGWSVEEVARLTPALQSAASRVEAYDLALPFEISLVRLHDASSLPWTQREGIVFTDAVFQKSGEQLAELILHELFHVLSRANPALRQSLYASIGFHPSAPLTFPEELRDLRMTNPDAPVLEHYIYVWYGGAWTQAMPITHARRALQVGDSLDIMQTVVMKLLLVDVTDDATNARRAAQGRLITFDLTDSRSQAVQSYMSQIGHNTQYIIHPEEVLADNFSYLMMGRRNQRSPEVLQKMNEILRSYEPATP